MAPDRTQLQNMSKREHESFKEYAQWWRDLVEKGSTPHGGKRDDHNYSGHVAGVLLRKVGGNG